MMRYRLMELIAESAIKGDYTYIPDVADHLISNGVIVLPVNVGDSIFAISAGRTKILTFIVTHLEVKSGGIEIWGKTHYTKEPIAICSELDIAEKREIFLTREEAEQALEKIKGGE